MIIFIDLFCGAGGVTTGIERAKHNKRKLGKVIACVNHDPKAIKSHALNHKKVLHFVEDIRTLELGQLKRLVDFYKRKYPHAAFAIWASCECTHHSFAAGGKARDADSRSLADHLDRYIEALDPDYIFLENVVEFMLWGPLDKKGKPIAKLVGTDYERWKEHIKSYGFSYDYKILNAADFGAFTSRKRYFAQFAKGDLPIQWPTPTHSKKGESGGNGLKKWRAVKEVLNFYDKGVSIFDRKKQLVENTLRRIYAGLLKYVANGDESYLAKYFSSHNNTRVNSGASTNAPGPTITTHGRVALVQPEFIMKYLSNNAKTGINSGASVQNPFPTITTQNRLALVQAEFSGTTWLDKAYTGKDNHQSVLNPAGTLMTRDKYSLVQTEWIDRQFSSGGRHSSIDAPAGSLLTVPKMSLVQVEPIGDQGVNKPRAKNYLTNPQWLNKSAHSIDKPMFTLIARMDKAPPSLITVDNGYIPAIIIYDTDSETMKKIKIFMSVYGITDIKMRMLKVPELLKIQGFPKGYKLMGTQADKKKFIGNSVVPQMAEAIIEAASLAYIEFIGYRMAA